MTAKSGSQPQNGQWPCRQLREVDALRERLGAARQERPERQHAGPDRGSAAHPAGVRSVGASASTPEVAMIPLRDERLRARGRRASSATICSWSAALERLVALQDVGRLAQRQPEVGPLERDVAEADGRPSGRLLRARATSGRAESTAAARAPARAAACPRARSACRSAAASSGCGALQLLELDDFARFGARGAAGRRSFGHGAGL